MRSFWDDVNDARQNQTVNVTVLVSLIDKLTKSEKAILREKGMHPSKDRTHTLLHYMDRLTADETNLLLHFLNRDSPVNEIHEGHLGLISKVKALDAIHKHRKKGPLRGGVTGRRADVIIADDVVESKGSDMGDALAYAYSWDAGK